MGKKIYAILGVVLFLVAGATTPVGAGAVGNTGWERAPRLVEVNRIADNPVSAAYTGYAWHKIADWYFEIGQNSNNWMVVRLAMQVNYINSVAHDVRSYHAVTCTVHGRPNNGGDRYPCSYTIEQRLWEKIVGGSTFTVVDNIPTNVTNTGTDGFYSRYGRWYIVAGHCDNFFVDAQIGNMGLAGNRASGSQYPFTQEWSYC